MEREIVYHVPVMLNESVDGLDIKAGGVYVDVTFGGGGHSKEILSRIHKAGSGHLYSFDQDADAADNAEMMDSDSCFTFVRSNFRYLKNFLRYYGEEQIDGLLADLGVSSHHFDDSERGFSFRFDSKLDMRMNQSARLTAADVVNTYSEEQLAQVLYLYGELRQSRKLASAIVKARQKNPLQTVGQFIDILPGMSNEGQQKKDLARVFQALRIEVNHEMDALRDMLNQAVEMLRPGGRLVVITYHSLEDRIVKNMMRTGNCDGQEQKDFFGRISFPLRLVNNKVIIPSAEEQTNNPRSRSAKLRVAERI